MKMINRIRYNFFQFCLGLIFSYGGWYGYQHLNYLDDVRITNPPIRAFEHLTTGFVDDLWFVNWVLFTGAIILLGVLIGYRWVKDTGLISGLAIVALIEVAFFQRGVLDEYFNLTWFMAFLAFAGILNELWNGRHGHDGLR
ncbi:hypothetical protein [Pediococcus claussenii]|uniref:hypothetical protein n=1 Tax=Pediococcus claussenii TaxID=187452 RepID=UPI00081A4C99|nr:hypothetical protein [Pediococcus claussenii]ANZ70383.1 hypothetical protein AYR57_08665 [Pediococcus claussenii]ANZ72199.1 hypothetical protein AYR58_08665 [Pediococcus claussenii]